VVGGYKYLFFTLLWWALWSLSFAGQENGKNKAACPRPYLDSETEAKAIYLSLLITPKCLVIGVSIIPQLSEINFVEWFFALFNF